LDNTAGYGEGAVDFYTVSGVNSDTDNPSARWYVVDDGNYSAHQYFQTKETGQNEGDMITRLAVRTDGNVGIGVEQPNTTLDVAGNIALRDTDNEFAATFDVQNQLSDDVTLTIPDQSGTLAVVADIPTEVTDLAATGISADYVPVAQGDGTIVWEAQSGGGGDTVSIQSTAADILSVSSGAISADDAGADRIVYWNNTSNKLAYGTPADVGAAASSHTHSDATQSVAGFLSTADKTKLDGIASGAEVNVTQVAAGNHTHVVSDVTGAAASGSITSSGLTQATARILGRTTASTGAVEEITVGSGLSLSAGELSSTVSAGIPVTIVDAKGDLIVGSAADTAARLAVGGTNGHVLTVDSAETLGVKWAAAAGGGSSIMQSIAVGFVLN
jgi:hypothetical protein